MIVQSHEYVKSFIANTQINVVNSGKNIGLVINFAESVEKEMILKHSPN